MKTNFKIISLNMNFLNENATSKRTIDDVLLELSNSDNTFISIQEFGKKSVNGDLNGIEIQNRLAELGYDVLLPNKEGKNPVNVRLFYRRSEVTFLEKELPISNEYLNRQCGGSFFVGGEEISVYSLYLPLASDDFVGKELYWDDILNFALKKVLANEKIILTGDFNESEMKRDDTKYYLKISELGKLFSEKDKESTWENKRLDHIFVSPALEKKVETFETYPVGISNHKKISVKINLAR
ncbi:endonuclease/exonuclease/phosphatase family protein [Dellaglioa algida]|uniref:endonuclease/exonuclease/phosphatase family protein n=2 Tax=Dellaglioa algida TaxID=105612 RepID=UPI000BC4125F|nr:endonuclease/exonuclease/phosphatase family protein [Dellaglioa algida]MDK1718320.1 endonuclease/exonuclease/phosphatase family protein [Dellaglioa algida]MDK1728105.1 endonuclease/exonuclease/phosphatase family protein [Dellaglioa algida]MDK1729588.1 endonuclease/exonuclease/phosphatase family protein [Dellaglioa algida]MDK1735757.1 endonuclease/exonuclease/phosphatase family protein [Dellaglioa algida]MDK1737436.1 endonuclease/exonuclease/phosphatase family protein [Dellaglioa algida]